MSVPARSRATVAPSTEPSLARYLGRLALATLVFAVVALALGVGLPVLWHYLFHSRTHEGDVAMAIGFGVPPTLLPAIVGFALATLARQRQVGGMPLRVRLGRACVTGVGAAMLCWGWLFALDALLDDAHHTTRLWAVSVGTGLLTLLVTLAVHGRPARR